MIKLLHSSDFSWRCAQDQGQCPGGGGYILGDCGNSEVTLPPTQPILPIPTTDDGQPDPTTDTTLSTSTLSPDLCFVSGEVSGVLIGVVPTSSYENCLEECRNLSGCLWFSEYYEESLCGMFKTMTDIHDDDCPSCISGNHPLTSSYLNTADYSFTVLIINDRPYWMQHGAGRMQPAKAL